MTDLTAFWRRKPLEEMTRQEWESLCDGCGRCCLVKFEEETSGEILFTNVACRLLNTETCRCRDYAHRTERIADCSVLWPPDPDRYRQLPETCAYRRLAEGGDLPQWHPLVSGDPATVVRAGISIGGKVLSEEYVHPDQLEEHIIRF
jgi:uncharacterized cysteine cluster protein YcgN (CxxCxxCC family)